MMTRLDSLQSAREVRRKSAIAESSTNSGCNIMVQVTISGDISYC